MREILFRGRRIDNGEWIEGFLIFDREFCGKPDHHSYIVNHSHPSGCFGCDVYIEVDPSTVGQYTGLKDRNGVQIFEGDVIKTHYANTPKTDFIEQVVFHNGHFCGMYERDKMKMWAALPDGIKRLPQDKSVYMEWCEVIGNIHDNPKLLEV